MRKYIFSSQEIQYIINEYKRGNNITKISEYLHAPFKAVRRTLEENNIVIRKHRLMENIDYNIFDTINSADKAYWLGFIVGDGYINEKRHFLSIKLNIKDINHLYKFCDFIGRDHTAVKTMNGAYNNTICYVYVTSKHLVQSLVNLNIRQGKSGHEHVPPIPKQYIRDYLRGLFDADGCIAEKRIDISNSIENLEFIQKFINDELNIKSHKIFEHQNTYRTCYYKISDMIAILSMLYNEANTYLDRKFEKAMDLITSNCRMN